MFLKLNPIRMKKNSPNTKIKIKNNSVISEHSGPTVFYKKSMKFHY